MKQIISSLILVIGLGLVFHDRAAPQLPANTCYFGVTGNGTGAAQALVCTDQARFSGIQGQSCLPAAGFVLGAQLPNGNCLPVSVFAPTGTVATLQQQIPGFIWWDQDKLSTRPCPSYWTPGIPCITIAKNIRSGVEATDVGIQVQP